MFRKRMRWTGLVILLLGLVGVRAADAQGGLAALPSQLSIAAPRGAVETRTVLLQATTVVTDVQVIPLDLTRTDGKAILPAAGIHPTAPPTTIAANGVITVPVQFDLRGVPSGEFRGDLLVRYGSGELTIPVTVTVKDNWPWPLLVLLLGVGLGVAVSAYRGGGRPRDQVLVRIGQLRKHMQDEPEPESAGPFFARIGAGLVDIEALLQAEKWTEAQTATDQAEACLNKWRRGRDDWRAQLAYQAELRGQIGLLDATAPALLKVRRQLEDAARNAPDVAGPDVLRTTLDGLGQQVLRYAQLQGKLKEMNALRNRLPQDQAESWRARILDLEKQLQALPLEDEAAGQAWQTAVEAAMAELQALVPKELAPAPPMQDAGKGASVPPFAPPPSAGPLRDLVEAAAATRRLRIFTVVSYAIAVGMLAGAGFVELYLANATFGANTWSDYFTLLAWGFGAEASRAAIMQMVRGWGLAGVG